MKTIVHALLLAFGLGTNAAHAQASEGPTPSKDYFSYDLKVEARVTACDIDGVAGVPVMVDVAPAGAAFTVVGVRNDACVVRFWDWSTGSPNAAKFNFNDPEKREGRKYFLLSKEDLTSRAQRRFMTWRPSFTAGTVIIPIKMRSGPFDFSKDFTLGPTVGVQFRVSKHHENYCALLLGLGVTSVTVDSATTSGEVLQPSDRAALTPSLGFVFEFDQVQIGLFAGQDHLSRKDPIDWCYQGKTWFSVGLGYTILSRTSAAKQGGKEEQERSE